MQISDELKAKFLPSIARIVSNGNIAVVVHINTTAPEAVQIKTFGMFGFYDVDCNDDYHICKEIVDFIIKNEKQLTLKNNCFSVVALTTEGSFIQIALQG